VQIFADQYVSPRLAGAWVKGELFPTWAARTCLTIWIVSPYLAGKRDLDDISRVSSCDQPGELAYVSPFSILWQNLGDTHQFRD